MLRYAAEDTKYRVCTFSKPFCRVLLFMSSKMNLLRKKIVEWPFNSSTLPIALIIITTLLLWPGQIKNRFISYSHQLWI